MNIYFRPPLDQLILDGKQTITIRCWKQKPPKVGQVLSAQTGYARNTRFADLLVTKVFEWTDDIKITDDLAKKVGYDSVRDFELAYQNLYGDKSGEKGRTKWFIKFEVLKTYR